MDCTLCQHLESELAHLECIHTGKLGILEVNWQMVRRGEYSRLRSAESDARLDLEIARAELNQHKRHQHEVN